MHLWTLPGLLAALALLMAVPAVAGEGDQQVAYDIVRAKGELYNPWTGAMDPVELRSFRGNGAKDGDFVAPTIRIAPGKRLTVDINNALPACTATELAEKRCHNDTNLHTHGLWVSPSGNSDNVLVNIAPGERFRYEYDIPADHPAGTFWYHPHRHGNSFVQVGSGMAGALIVTGNRKPTLTTPGDIDILLKDAGGKPMAERVMLLQQIQYACTDDKGAIEGVMKDYDFVRPWTCAPGRVGGIETPELDWDWVSSGRFTGINGKVQPELAPARVGTFERWRLVHAGVRERVPLQIRLLDPAAPDLNMVRAADQSEWIKRYCSGPALPMWNIAMDGLTRTSVARTDVTILFPGDRMDMIVHYPVAGRYCLIHTGRRGTDMDAEPTRVLAVVRAEGPAAPAGDPEVRLKDRMIAAASRTLDGAVRDKVTAELADGLKLTSFAWHKPIPLSEVTGYREAILNIIEPPDANDVLFHVNGRPYDHDRFDMVLPLGATEQWHVTSLVAGHPIHIHVNPFQIIKIVDKEGRDVTDPAKPEFDPDYAGLIGEWKDNVFVKEGHKVLFRTRYERFTGDFVTHCHIMYHGDHGMMMNLRIADLRGDGGKDGEPAGHH